MCLLNKCMSEEVASGVWPSQSSTIRVNEIFSIFILTFTVSNLSAKNDNSTKLHSRIHALKLNWIFCRGDTEQELAMLGHRSMENLNNPNHSTMVQIINECFISAAVMALVCFFSYTEHITTTHRLPFFADAVDTDTDVTTTTNYPGVKWHTAANHEEMIPIATRQEYPPTIDEDDTPVVETNSFWHTLPTTESPVVEEEVKDIIWEKQLSTSRSFNWHDPSLLESPSELEEVKDEDVVNGAVLEETEYLQEKDPCEEEPIRALRSGGRISKKSRVSHVFQVHVI